MSQESHFELLIIQIRRQNFEKKGDFGRHR